MKIGLISINTHTKSLNPACPVHTWAFQQFLAQNGIESTVIDYYPNYNNDFPSRDPVPYYEKKYADQKKKVEKSENPSKEMLDKLKRYKDSLDGYTALRQERMDRFDKFQRFIDDSYVKTDVSYDNVALEKQDPGFDCYICVTDVIWSCDPYWGFDPGFLLNCSAMDNKWKIAYAASQGTPKKHTPEQKDYFFHALDDMQYIGVREESLKNYIQKGMPHKPVSVVLDPVLLLEADYYDRIIVRPKETDYIVVYYAMERPNALLRVAADYAKRHNCLVIELSHIPIPGGLMKDRGVELAYKFDIGPGEWLGYIKYARCIFTNSFHATCFSVLFHKNFFTGSRHGDKLTHALEIFDLDSRRIAVAENTDLEIDYRKVEKLLEKRREESAQFILSAIHDLEDRAPQKRDYTYRKLLPFQMAYNSGIDGCVYLGGEVSENESLIETKSGHLEYRSKIKLGRNTGKECLMPLFYERKGYRFIGWYVRIRIGTDWYWVKHDGTIVPDAEYDPTMHEEESVFPDQAQLPYIHAEEIAVMVADGVWEKGSPFGKKLFSRK